MSFPKLLGYPVNVFRIQRSWPLPFVQKCVRVGNSIGAEMIWTENEQEILILIHNESNAERFVRLVEKD